MNILIVDFLSLAFRSFYGCRPLKNSRGEPTTVLYTSIRTLLKEQREQKYNKIIVCTDQLLGNEQNAPSVRKQISPLYKLNRVKEAKPLFWQDATNLLKLFDLLGIEIYSAHSGYEGDDCIGSLVKTLQNEQVGDFKISIMSGDTDFAQLITQDGRVVVRRLLPKKIETMDYEGCLTLYGVPPCRVTDFKALAGDGADMILGVKSCGRKTAQRYISAHGSALQATTVECSLQPYKEQILRDLQLATIVCDLPMQKREAELMSLDAAKLFLEQLECPSLLKQISELYALSLFHS